MKKIIFSLFAVMLLLNITTAQDQSTAYNWPVKPGTPEWKALQTHDEMLVVLQIPANILNKMSTENLVETCLNYPLFPDVWVFNSYQNGIDKAITSFNGFRELIKRTGSGSELLKKYQQINLSDLNDKTDAIEQWEFKMQVCKLEALLSQYSILQNITKPNRVELLKETLNKNKIIRESGKFSFFSYDSNSYLIAKILSIDSPELINRKVKEDKDFQKFINIGTGITPKLINDMLELADLYLSNNN